MPGANSFRRGRSGDKGQDSESMPSFSISLREVPAVPLVCFLDAKLREHRFGDYLNQANCCFAVCRNGNASCETNEAMAMVAKA